MMTEEKIKEVELLLSLEKAIENKRFKGKKKLKDEIADCWESIATSKNQNQSITDAYNKHFKGKRR